MIPERYSPLTYALMRIVFGLLWLIHGLTKFGIFSDRVVPLASLNGLGGIIELIAGGLIMVGLFTRPAAFLASGQMAVAYFLRHHPQGPLPINNGGEPAVLFCFAFLYIASRGPGILSLDALLKRR